MSEPSESNRPARPWARPVERPDPGRRTRAAFDQRSRALIRGLAGGLIAVVVALYWLIRELGLDPAELLDFAITSLAFIALFAVPGVAVGAAIGWLRRRR
ncbi:MAG: hypothetical protein ACO3Z6_00790 [Pseudomonadales bacterium]|jgi:hypothetical protein